MRDSWWTLGEGSGFSGQELSLSLYRITCPFCMESGNYSLAFHAEKKQPNRPRSSISTLWLAERNFRRVKGYKQLPKLLAELAKLNTPPPAQARAA